MNFLIYVKSSLARLCKSVSIWIYCTLFIVFLFYSILTDGISATFSYASFLTCFLGLVYLYSMIYVFIFYNRFKIQSSNRFLIHVLLALLIAFIFLIELNQKQIKVVLTCSTLPFIFGITAKILYEMIKKK